MTNKRIINTKDYMMRETGIASIVTIFQLKDLVDKKIKYKEGNFKDNIEKELDKDELYKIFEDSVEEMKEIILKNILESKCTVVMDPSNARMTLDQDDIIREFENIEDYIEMYKTVFKEKYK